MDSGWRRSGVTGEKDVPSWSHNCFSVSGWATLFSSFGSGKQHFWCCEAEGQQTRGPPWVAKDLATPPPWRQTYIPHSILKIVVVWSAQMPIKFPVPVANHFLNTVPITFRLFGHILSRCTRTDYSKVFTRTDHSGGRFVCCLLTGSVSIVLLAGRAANVSLKSRVSRASLIGSLIKVSFAGSVSNVSLTSRISNILLTGRASSVSLMSSLIKISLTDRVLTYLLYALDS